MFQSLSRSWSLVKASGAVLKQDKELLMFPLISALATLVVIACFALPIFGLGALDGLSNAETTAEDDSLLSLLAVALAFLFYVALYFVIFFFNAALVGAAMMRFDGGDPTVSDGLRIAMSKFGSILGYACIAATVGMILRAIQERVGFVGKIVVGLLGAGWTVATYMVAPVLVARDVGPLDAIKESAGLLKKTWGENIVGQAGIGVVFVLIQFALLFGGGVLVAVAVSTGSGVVVGLTAVLVLAAVMLAALIQAALGGIYAAALYRFADTGENSSGFDAGVLQLAFAPKA